MDSGRAREIFTKFAGAMAFISVEKPDSTLHIGSAFHVGEGVFVTARHVVEGFKIREVATTERVYVRLDGAEAEGCTTFIGGDNDEEHPVHIVRPARLSIAEGPYFSRDATVDVAVFRVADLDLRAPLVKLGDHLDDWLGASDFVLRECIVFGYPPIPFTAEPYLVAARAEINAQVFLRAPDHAHFLLSTMARGGFSGGLAITEYEAVLGVVTKALLKDDQPSELGFLTALSVEPIYNCLADHKLLPVVQAAGWDDFWNAEWEMFFPAGTDVTKGGRVAGSVDIFDDAKRLVLQLSCDDRELLTKALDRALECFNGLEVRREDVNDHMLKVHLGVATTENRDRLEQGRRAARRVYLDAGLLSTQRDADGGLQ